MLYDLGLFCSVKEDQVASFGMCMAEKVEKYVKNCRHNIFTLPMLESFNTTMGQDPPTVRSEDWESMLAPSTNIGHAVHTVTSLAYHVYGLCNSGKDMQ